MARLESKANAGFEPVPQELVPGLASLVDVSQVGEYAVLDPCSGEGAAIIGMTQAWWGESKRKSGDIELYACEMEKTRFEKLKAQEQKTGLARNLFKPVHGDAFALQWDSAKVSIGYVNPPFDPDPSEARRLEEKFLRRIVPMIYDGGVLMYVLPYYALKHSAYTIARNFKNVHVVRFPDADFSADPKARAYKRVVVLGEKHPTLIEPDPNIAETLLRCSAEWQPIPDTWDRPLVKAQPLEGAGIEGWRVAAIDLEGILSRVRPWHFTDRGGRMQPIQGVVPERPSHESMECTFPVALPLKPAYLAAGIAAGVFNGEMVMPDDPASGMPPLLLKGVFRKDFVRAPEEDKHNKDGDKTQETHVQQPELVITVLDLSTKRYSQLLSSVDTTGAMTIAEMSVGDLLLHYGKSMLASLRKACPVMHDPAKDAAVEVPGIARKLYHAQAHAVTAALKLLGGIAVPLRMRRGQTAYILGEVGVGKTGISLATCVAMGAKRVLVMVPPITVPVWQKQVKDWFPEARAVVIESVHDVHALASDTDERITFAIMSRETAKLGHAWGGVSHRVGNVRDKHVVFAGHCPSCGTQTHADPEELARKRSVCQATHYHAGNEYARIAERLGQVIAPAAPKSPHVYQVCRSRMMRRALMKWREKPIENSWQKALDSRRLESIAETVADLLLRCDSRERAVTLGTVLEGLLVALDNQSAMIQAARALYMSTAKESYTYTAEGQKRTTAMRLLAMVEKTDRDPVVAELRDAVKLDLSYGQRNPWYAFDTATSVIDSEGSCQDSTYQDITSKTWKDHKYGTVGAATLALETLCGTAHWVESERCGERLYQATPDPRRVALAPYIAKRFGSTFDALILDECFVAGTIVSGKPIETIRVGDMVDAFDERTGAIARRTVTRLYKSNPSALLRVDVGGASLYCTPGHPFFTRRGWIRACDLESTDYILKHELRNFSQTQEILSERRHRPERLDGKLSHVRNPDRVDWSRDVPCETARAWILQSSVQYDLCQEEAERSGASYGDQGQGTDQASNAHTQPDAQPRGESEGDCLAGGTWRCVGSACARWQWEGTNAAAEDACRGARLGNGSSGSDAEEARTRVSDGVQDRRWECGKTNRDRGGRVLPQQPNAPSDRREEGRVLAWHRVESVQVQERGSDGTFGGVCPDGFVFNLEVEELHTYIANGVVVHNCHELSNNGDSAQSRAMQRLVQLGLPTLALTGSLMNGYAKSIFAGQWALDPDFRREFDRNEEGAFVQRYGYLKVKVEYKDKDSGKTVVFGAVSDRVERTEREAGSAPGILPLFVLQYLLRRAVVIHKEDLNIDLPSNKQIAERIVADEDLSSKYRALSEALRHQIRRDAFGPLAGKLFGQTNRVAASLDMMARDVSGDVFELRYPDDAGGGLVASQSTFETERLTAKETWILETTRRELAEGRNVLIYAHHTDLLPRLRRLVQEQLGEPCALILASESEKVEKTAKRLPPGQGPVVKLSPKKREPWIEEHVTGKVCVLVINSAAVQVGLNSLVWFNTIIWTENPACNPIAFRQANGRIYRPGQTKETRVYFPVYERTAQAAAHSLLMQKVAVSEGTDGLDARAAMAAAGVGEQATLSAFSVGKQLFSMMEQEEARPATKQIVASTEKRAAPPIVEAPRPEPPVKRHPQLSLF